MKNIKLTGRSLSVNVNLNGRSAIFAISILMLGLVVALAQPKTDQTSYNCSVLDQIDAKNKNNSSATAPLDLTNPVALMSLREVDYLPTTPYAASNMVSYKSDPSDGTKSYSFCGYDPAIKSLAFYRISKYKYEEGKIGVSTYAIRLPDQYSKLNLQNFNLPVSHGYITPQQSEYERFNNVFGLEIAHD